MSAASDQSTSDMIAQTAQRLFAGMEAQAFAALPPHPGKGAIGWQGDMWDKIEDLGFPLALLDAESGGFDLDPLTAMGLIRQAAFHALPLPLGETMLAHLVAGSSGLTLPQGPAALVTGLTLAPQDDGWRVTGAVADVPWGRTLAALVAVDAGGQVAVITKGWQITQGHNLASEPRDSLTLDLAVSHQDCAPTNYTPAHILSLGALIRAQALAGALEAVLDRTIAYTNMREQFGRPLSKFQAIQHNIAIMATHVAASRAGADMAASALPLALTQPAHFTRQVAAAKLRASEAAGLCAALAHQMHGAIGVTRAFALHPLTTRLWTWRDDYGAERYWADHLGAEVVQGGPDAFWPYLTTTQERLA